MSSSARIFDPSPSSSSSSEEKKAATSVSLADARNLAKPASESGMSVDPVAGFNNTDMAGPMGLKSQLFADSLRNDDERFSRLENAVQSIRDELDTLKPPVNRLIAIEKDIQDLIAQLEILLTQESAAAPPANNPQAVVTTAQSAQPPPAEAGSPPTAPPQNLVASDQMAAGQTAQPPPNPRQQTPPAARPPDTSGAAPQAAGPFVVRTIRMGDHANKTRLVIESDRKLSYRAAVDNGEKLLTVTFDQAQLGIDAASIAMSSRLLSNVTSSPQSGGGLVLIFNLTKDSAVINQGQIGPNKDNVNHRLFIDLRR